MFARVSDIDRMFGAMDLLQNRMDTLFKGIHRPYFPGPALTLTSNSPRTNLLESGDSFKVQAEVPGISKDDLNIKIQGNYLEITGKRSVDTRRVTKFSGTKAAAAPFHAALPCLMTLMLKRQRLSLKTASCT